MSTAAIDASQTSTEFIESDPNVSVLDSTVQHHTTWDGRKWGMIGPHNNLPPFMHHLCGLTSSIFESTRWALETIGQSIGTQGVLSHGSNMLETIRDTIDYTGFINVIYQTAKFGPDFFVDKEANEEGVEELNILKTASNATFVAIDLLFPVHFVMSRLERANIGNTTDLAAAKDFINNGFPVTPFLTAAGALWSVASGFTLANTIREIGHSVHQAVSDEMEFNKEYTTTDLIRAGWNKGASWKNLNKLQVSAFAFGFSVLNGGIFFPNPQGVVKMAALAFKGIASVNAVTQTFLGEKVKLRA